MYGVGEGGVTRKDEYIAHLRSAAWQQIRRNALVASDGLCEFCGQPATDVHHVRYPKSFKDDTHINTIPVCRRCHKLSHGGKEMLKLVDGRKASEISPLGAELNYWIVNGAPWAPLNEWCDALAFPEPERFRVIVKSKAIAHLAALGQASEAELNGVIVYRWAVVAEAMRRIDRDYHHGKFDRLPTWIDWKKWMDNFDRLHLWGSQLQEKALTAMIRSSSAVDPVDRLADTIQQLAEVTRGTFALAKDTSALALNTKDRVDRLEVTIGSFGPTLKRDPSEFLTARVGVKESSLDETACPLSPMSDHNWEQLVGIACRKLGCVPGPKIMQRLSDSGRITPVNTWRRSDIQRAIALIRAKVAQSSRAA